MAGNPLKTQDLFSNELLFERKLFSADFKSAVSLDALVHPYIKVVASKEKGLPDYKGQSGSKTAEFS